MLLMKSEMVAPPLAPVPLNPGVVMLVTWSELDGPVSSVASRFGTLYARRELKVWIFPAR